MPKTKQLLTGAEAKIIGAIWERPGRTMMEITAALEAETGWSKHTVTTLLKRMVGKGTVVMDASGPVRRYFPAIAREEMARRETRGLLERFYGGSAARLTRDLLAEGLLSRADIEAMLHTKDA